MFATSHPVIMNAPCQDSVSGVLNSASRASEFEDALAHGFRNLQFAPGLEERYLQSNETQWLHTKRQGLIVLLVQIGITLLADWCLVPDQFHAALMWRLLVQAPLALASLLALKHVPRAFSECLIAAMGWLMAGITCHLSVSSTDPMAPDYLVALYVILLFNAGVINLRFRMALQSTFVVIAIFVAGAFLTPHPPVPILLSSMVVMISVAVFALFTSYRREHDDRTNWLMLMHQSLLHDEVTDSSRHLDRLARFDPLTDLANRRHLDEFLRQVCARAQRNGESIALLMIDIDHFKSYNDCHGHAQGDLCLQGVAQVLKMSVRQSGDLMARYGGEEFVAVLPESDLAMAMAVAHRIRQGVADLHLEHEASPGLKHVTVSIGVACLRADQAGVDAAHLIACADAALYKAKDSGRNVVLAHEPQDAPPHQVREDLPQPLAETATEPGAPDAQHEEVAQAMLQMERSSTSLAFPPQLEQRFEQDIFADRLNYFAKCGLLSFVMFLGFSFVDLLLIDDVIYLAIKIRLCVFAPIALVLLYLVWFEKAWLRRLSPVWAEGIIVLSAVWAAACLGYILSASHSPMSQLYHVGLAVIIIYGNLVQRLRFGYALAFSAAVLLVHAVGVMTLPEYNHRLTPPLLLLMLATITITLMANHAMERNERRCYLLSLNQRNMIEQLEAVRGRLQTLARVDTLTGLFNRRHFHDYLQLVWRRAEHSGDDVAIVILDVDHFKKFNDRYGHQAGDVCLAKVAQAMKGALRQPGDLAARLGGEEFIAVLPNTSLAQAHMAAERVRLAVQALHIPHEASSTAAVVTASLGVVGGPVNARLTHAEMMVRADKALYQAKRAGRNRVYGWRAPPESMDEGAIMGPAT